MKRELLRTEIARGIKQGFGVDREKGVIRGFAVMTKGFIKDQRGWEIDDATLDQVAQAGNSLKTGLKSRFGHPMMSSEALGTFLGRVKNFGKEGDVVRADLYFDESAYKTPDGDLATYVMDLAENDPEAFGASVVLLEYDLAEQFEADGKTPKKDANGNPLPGRLRVAKLSSVDVVDEPAANDGFFGKFFPENVKLSSAFAKVLDQFIQNPEAVDKAVAFLGRYQKIRNEDTKKEEIGMDLKSLTLEILKTERPDLVEALSKESKTAVLSEGAAAERKRVLGILAKAELPEYVNMRAILKTSVENGDDLEAAESKFKDQRIKDLETLAPKTPGPGDGDEGADASNLSVEERCKRDWETKPEIQKEFSSLGSYTSYVKAKERGQVKEFKK
ncbi:MAG: hypothetical protein HZA37_01245 [Parcubacteria group bacterium]|nr:hypothetical protein [Parcubacteria group bacterium]